jgi:putative Ca2+/H+ antiporter (TMEM165/GDT1 family)
MQPPRRAQVADGPDGPDSVLPAVRAFFVSFGVIFVAELGDKSQLMALAFATRFKAWRVLVGITVATAITHAASVAIGRLVAENLPTRAITIVAGIAFLGFAAWTLRGDSLDEDDEDAAVKAGRRGALAAIAAIGATFLLAELGDKTMLATITLATHEDVFGTWLGSTLGMVAADALAIVVGQQLGARLPERVVRIGAASLFVLFGLALVVDGIVE